MAYLVAGGLVLAFLLYAAGAFSKANPAVVAKRLKVLFGILLLPVCAFLAVTGRWVVAIPVAAFALSLLGIGTFGRANPFGALGGMFGGAGRSKGQASSVRSAYIEMVLDHDSGTMDGRVVKGAMEGAALSQLSNSQLEALWREVALEADSLALLEAYLDSRFSNWRVNFNAHSTAGQGEPSSSGSLTEEEAYQILGLTPGASADEIRLAHRKLIKRVHPDSGGSAFLASKLNEAKDRLLRGH
ncbi:molecular chaperone DnaJ [Rhodobacteraceae bacterium RKSG542]|uniref:DnaJ domain-containing protein n=1 Tax=Pseudovibrio flavus TaxID=2529854 RepID=UPI0012BCD1AB|nr:DnaJ domain-containing protein [Pseudovibrio flavus]MTI16400.1 molecular chaperone DnaJ [Pseudovibrio flavus]